VRIATPAYGVGLAVVSVGGTSVAASRWLIPGVPQIMPSARGQLRQPRQAGTTGREERPGDEERRGRSRCSHA
jgi:hypothetical protein